MKSLVLRPRTFAPSEPDAVLVQRALRFRRIPRRDAEDAPSAEHVWAARIRIGGDTYALPLAQVRAAMPLRMVSAVPLAPPHVLGILRYRGEPLVAMSLVSLLGVRGWRVDPAVLIVVDTGVRRIALDCEEVPQAVSLGETDVAGAREKSPGAAVVSVPRTDDTPLLWIDDLEALIRSRVEGSGAG